MPQYLWVSTLLCRQLASTGSRGREGLSSGSILAQSAVVVGGQEPLESPSLPMLPVLASYIAELKPTSTEAPVGLYKSEAWASAFISRFLQGNILVCPQLHAQ